MDFRKEHDLRPSEKSSPQRLSMSRSTTSLPFLPASGDALQKWMDASPPTRDVVKEAHDDAIKNLKVEFHGKEDVIAWLEKLNTIEEVHFQISELQKRYENDIKFKNAKRWLHKLSSVVLHYGQALDMLAQQTPAYVSLVWGTMRFILTAVMNKEKQLAEYTEALVYIGDLLPRVQLNAELYQNNFVEAAVARLYEQVLLFFRPAIKWYSSSLRRFLFGVFEPFEVLKDTVTKIKACAAIMNEAAMSSMQIEVRQTHEIALKTHEIVTSELPNLHSGQQWQDCVSAGVGQIQQDVKAALEILYGIHDKVRVTDRRAGDIQNRVRGIESRLEFKALRPSTLPIKALVKHRSVSRAKQPWTMQNQDIVCLLTAIGGWIESPESTLLVITAMHGRDIAAELVGGILQPKAKHICWHLSAGGEAVTTAGILRSLAWQLHELDPPGVASCVDGNLDHTDQEQIAHLLGLILIRLGLCYLIIDADDIVKLPGSSAELDKLTCTLHDIIDRVSGAGSQVKVLLIGNGTRSRSAQAPAAATPSKQPRKVISLRPPVPIPASRQRHGAKAFLQTPRWLSLQNRVPNQS